MFVYVYVCMFICVCVFWVYIYTDIQTTRKKTSVSQSHWLCLPLADTTYKIVVLIRTAFPYPLAYFLITQFIVITQNKL